MDSKTLFFKIIIISLAFAQVSCKKTSSNKILHLQKPIKIDNTYQKDDTSNNETLKVNSVIQYSSKYNSPNLWRYKTELEKSDLVSFNVLNNGNIISVVKKLEYKKSIWFVLVLDKNGKELYRQNIGDGVSTYNFNESCIADNYDGGFTIYVIKGVNLTNRELIGTDDELENTRYEIEKMIFKKKGSGYTSENVSIRDVLIKPIIDKGFILERNLFSLYYLRGKIFINGTVKRSNMSEYPFLAVLDKNLKLLSLNVFEEYENTFINDITLYIDNAYYINGIKIKETDLFTTRTLQRFIVNEDLKVIEDHSDKRTPYYDRVHREPTPLEEKMLEIEFADDNSNLENKNNTIYNTRGNSNTVLNSNIFYCENRKNCYYSINNKGSESNEIVFNKFENDAEIWRIKVKFPKNSKNNWISENTTGLKRTNGDFILGMVVENLSSKHLFSTAIFVFNKNGKIIRQFEILGASDLKGIKESDGKLIINYIHDDGFLVNKKWQEHYAFYSDCYPLD